MKSTTKIPAKKAAKKKAQPVKEDKNAGIINEVVKFLQERIADGGATADHLQVMLNTIKPPAEQKTDFGDTGEGGTTRVL